MCVTGHTLKNHNFWKFASSFSSLRQLERSKSVNKHVCEKIPCSNVSKTPSTTCAERFGSLESSFNHFGTSCHFWVQKRATRGPGPVGPTKQGPFLTQPRQMRRLKMMKYHFFRRLRPHSRAGCCTCRKKSGPETRTIRQTESEFIGVGRREPAHGMQISCVGQGAA